MIIRNVLYTLYISHWYNIYTHTQQQHEFHNLAGWWNDAGFDHRS